MKILIVDDHAMVREGLRHVLADTFRKAEFGEARNAQEALAAAGKQKWDIVVLDITMPGRSGLEVLRELKHSHPKLPVLVLSMYPEDQFAIRILKSGAAGYMNKESAAGELVGAVKKLLAGGRYVSPALAEKMALYLDVDVKRPLHERLSDREFQIMRLIAAGQTVREIAERNFLSAKTVRTYRERILQKMGLKRNAELTRYAIQNRLVE